jgi:hypothetical protein
MKRRQIGLRIFSPKPAAKDNFHTLWKETGDTPSVATTKGVVIYACINQWAGELIVDSIHADSEEAEESLNQGRGATGEYAVYQAPLLG